MPSMPCNCQPHSALMTDNREGRVMAQSSDRNCLEHPLSNVLLANTPIQDEQASWASWNPLQ